MNPSPPILELAGAFKDASGLVTSMSFSPDGLALLVGSEDDVLRLYDMSNVRELSCLSSTIRLPPVIGLQECRFVGARSSLPDGTALVAPRNPADAHVYTVSLERSELISQYHSGVCSASKLGSSSTSGDTTSAGHVMRSLAHFPLLDAFGCCTVSGELCLWSPKHPNPIVRIGGRDETKMRLFSISKVSDFAFVTATEDMVLGFDGRMLGSGDARPLWKVNQSSLFTTQTVPLAATTLASATNGGAVPKMNAVGCLDMSPSSDMKFLATNRWTSELSILDCSNTSNPSSPNATVPIGSPTGSGGAAGDNAMVTCITKDTVTPLVGEFGRHVERVATQNALSLALSPAEGSGTSGVAKTRRVDLCCGGKYLSGEVGGHFIVQGTHRQRLLMFDASQSHYPMVQSVKAPQHLMSIPMIEVNPNYAMFASACSRLLLWSSATQMQLSAQIADE